jgi:hypothetical protein
MNGEEWKGLLGRSRNCLSTPHNRTELCQVKATTSSKMREGEMMDENEDKLL